MRCFWRRLLFATSTQGSSCGCEWQVRSFIFCWVFCHPWQLNRKSFHALLSVSPLVCRINCLKKCLLVEWYIQVTCILDLFANSKIVLLYHVSLADASKTQNNNRNKNNNNNVVACCCLHDCRVVPSFVHLSRE